MCVCVYAQTFIIPRLRTGEAYSSERPPQFTLWDPMPTNSLCLSCCLKRF